MPTLPHTAHGDTLFVVKIAPKNEGKGEARHTVGTQFNGLLLFDNCAQATIIVPGLDPAIYFCKEFCGIRFSGTACSDEIVKPVK